MKIRKKKITLSSTYIKLKNELEEKGINTVCVSAKCPNIEECFNKTTATFLVMGDICTRQCGFCSVSTGHPKPLDKSEPLRIANAVKEMKLKHAVITSVTRDDINDKGIGHFSEIIKKIRRNCPEVIIEILTPDFPPAHSSFKNLIRNNPPEIFNHNMETVPRLYRMARKGANYKKSLDLLKQAKSLNPAIYTKSGLILGMGEESEEIQETMKDIHDAEVDIITIGQYLPPSKESIKVQKTYSDNDFHQLEVFGNSLGFQHIYSGYFVRSSYNAAELFDAIKRNQTIRV